MNGFSMQFFYPVEGDSAIAELFYNGAQWASVWLEDIRVDAAGDARIDQARVIVSFVSRSAGEWELEFTQVSAQLENARARLLDNERGRVPMSDERLTNAGKALSKVADIGKWQQLKP